MTRNELKTELRTLIEEAKDIFSDELIAKLPEEAKKHNLQRSGKGHISTAQRYQNWFSKIVPLLRHTAPDRLEEFISQYRPDPRRKNLTTLNYTLQDYLQGFSLPNVESVYMFCAQFQHQIIIAEAILETFDQRLANIEAVVQADLFRHELEAADDLLSIGHLRAAGVMAGVSLEAHLRKVCKERGIEFKKQNPTISDYNDRLKKEDFIDTPTWRLIQRLGDIRNLCSHAKNREPTKDEVVDLISGTRKLISDLN